MHRPSNPDTILKNYLRRLRIIHYALVAGMVLICLFVYFLQKNPLAGFPAGQGIFIYLVPVAALSGYFAGIYIFNKLTGSLDKELSLARKLDRYQTASLLHYTCLEAPALLALYAYLNHGNLFYASIAAFLVIYLIAQRPTLHKILSRIPLNDQEKEALN